MNINPDNKTIVENNPFFSDYQTDTDEYLDPFNDKPKHTYDEVVISKPKREIPFETVIKRDFLSIGAILLITVVFINIIRTLWYEFITLGSHDLDLLPMITFIMIAGCSGFYLYYIIRAIKEVVRKKENINIKNSLITGGFALISQVIILLTNISMIPNRILFIAFLAALTVILIVMFIKLDRKDRSVTRVFLSIIFLVTVYLVAMKVVLIRVYQKDADYHAECYCIQAKSVDNFNKSTHAMQSDLMGNTNENEMYYSSSACPADAVFESKEEIDSYFEKSRETIRSNGEDNPVVMQINEEIQSFLEPALSKFDNEFFKDNVLIIKSYSYYENIDNVEFNSLFTRPSSHSVNFYTRIHSTDDPARTGYISYDNDGICFMLISLPKKYDYLLSYPNILMPNEVYY